MGATIIAAVNAKSFAITELYTHTHIRCLYRVDVLVETHDGTAGEVFDLVSVRTSS